MREAPRRRSVVVRLLDIKLDAGKRVERRWDSWRLIVAPGQQDDLVVDRFALLVPPGHQSPAASNRSTIFEPGDQDDDECFFNHSIISASTCRLDSLAA